MLLRRIFFKLIRAASSAGWKAFYHNFEADDAGGTVDDFGGVNLSYVKKYTKYYTFGIKYPAYSAIDNNVDADNVNVWVNPKFLQHPAM